MTRFWPPGGATLISGAPLTNPPPLLVSSPQRWLRPLSAFSPQSHAPHRSYTSPQLATAAQPPNVSTNSAASQIVENRYQQKPNGSTANAIKAFVTKSRRSKHKPTRHASANRSIFVPSLITSDDSDSSAVIEIPRIEPLQSLGLDHNALQHLIVATIGSPSEASEPVVV